MTWWTDRSIYVRDQDGLRILAEIVRIHCGNAIGRQIYPIVESDPLKVKGPYTIDHNRRPAIIAIYIALIDSANAPREYPRSASMAARIDDRKVESSRPGLSDAAKELVFNLNIVTLAWFRYMKKNQRAMLTSETKLRILLFSETVIRASQIYRETLERNRVLWCPESGDIPTGSSGFNFAFGIDYIDLAIADLASRDGIINRELHTDSHDDIDGLPDLIRDY